MKHVRDRSSPLIAATTQTGGDGHFAVREEGADADQEAVIVRNEKKPYTKPTYRYERVFETMALSCGKTDPTQLLCRLHRKNS
jgi:hypothetical protein